MERSNVPTKIVASCLALIGFAAAILAGLSVDNPASTTISRALVAMFVCYIIGLAVGAVAQRAVQEHVDTYKKEHPLEPPIATAQEAPSETAEPSTAAPASARTSGKVAA